ncbi:MAG TPA: phosphoadenylyl-sulfate reductase [Azospirillum sp.]
MPIDESIPLALTRRYGGLEGAELLAPLIAGEFRGRIAVVSSFGTESAVLLAMAAEADPAVPVLFVDTGKLFGETLRYRDRLVRLLGLRDVRTVGPTTDAVAAEAVASVDGDGMLWQRDPDACCDVRKTAPLCRALAGFDAWVTGRKRFQAATRAALPLFEAQDGRVKVNPLAPWSRARIEEEFARRDLPRHPLESDGFASIGCYTCTDRVAPGADPRSGRWAGHAKVECGIHLDRRTA